MDALTVGLTAGHQLQADGGDSGGTSTAHGSLHVSDITPELLHRCLRTQARAKRTLLRSLGLQSSFPSLFSACGHSLTALVPAASCAPEPIDSCACFAVVPSCGYLDQDIRGDAAIRLPVVAMRTRTPGMGSGHVA